MAIDPTQLELVIVESPYAGDVEVHVEYARRAMADSLKRGEAPFLSHLLYTQVLDDGDVNQRAHGIAAGFAWGLAASHRVFYVDYGWSMGMRAGRDQAAKMAQSTDIRRIGKNHHGR